MTILEGARAAIIVCTRDRARATEFYQDVLELRLAHEDDLAAVFHLSGDLNGATLRVSFVADFVAHEHTVLGFQVADVEATVNALRNKGVVFRFFAKFPQNELGILTLPGGRGRVAWFEDPDGNLLSVSDVK